MCIHRIHTITHAIRVDLAGTTNTEDYNTIDIAMQSEDNWDNEGGTFANPDKDYDLLNNAHLPGISSRVRYLGISDRNLNLFCGQNLILLVMRNPY